MTAARALIMFVAALAATGCELGKRVVITPFYRELPLPDARIARNLAYVEGPGAHPVKHRLDLFLPETRGSEGRGFTTVIFVHGGNWTEGDKSLHVAGADLYANLGRFLATHGYAAAVVNYRLLPGVAWEAQPADVASAVKWVRANIASYGGSPDDIVLMGHSAGAQLAALVAVDPRWLQEAGVPRRAIRGVIAVSGAGFDLADQETYRLFGGTQASVTRRFGIEITPERAREASPVNYLDKDDPPFLLMYPSGDKRGGAAAVGPHGRGPSEGRHLDVGGAGLGPQPHGDHHRGQPARPGPRAGHAAVSRTAQPTSALTSSKISSSFDR